MAVPKKKRSNCRNKKRYSFNSILQYKNYKKNSYLCNPSVLIFSVDSFILSGENKNIKNIAKYSSARIAQQVEHLSEKQRVGSSNLPPGT